MTKMIPRADFLLISSVTQCPVGPSFPILYHPTVSYECLQCFIYKLMQEQDLKTFPSVSMLPSYTQNIKQISSCLCFKNLVALPWESKAQTFPTVPHTFCSSSSFPSSCPTMSSCNVCQPSPLFSYNMLTTCTVPCPTPVFTSFPICHSKPWSWELEQLTQDDCLNSCSILAFCSLTSSNYHNLELVC